MLLFLLPWESDLRKRWYSLWWHMILSIISHFRCHLYIFISEVSVLITCPFCNWIIVGGGIRLDSLWDLSSLTREWTWFMAVKVQNPNGHTTRKLQELFSAWVLRFFVYFGYHSIITRVWQIFSSSCGLFHYLNSSFHEAEFVNYNEV